MNTKHRLYHRERSFFTTRKETVYEVFIFSYLKIIKKNCCLPIVSLKCSFFWVDRPTFLNSAPRKGWDLNSLLLPSLRSVFLFFLAFSVAPTWEPFYRRLCLLCHSKVTQNYETWQKCFSEARGRKRITSYVNGSSTHLTP